MGRTTAALGRNGRFTRRLLCLGAVPALPALLAVDANAGASSERAQYAAGGRHTGINTMVSTRGMAAMQPDDQLPPTIFISEVKGWCTDSEQAIAQATFEFLPGNERYLDRVRLAPFTPLPDTPYLTFDVPLGIAVSYIDETGQPAEVTPDSGGQVDTVEALFTRVEAA